MLDLSDLISEQANQFIDRRMVAFERIQIILGTYNVPIKLFGSCASGIAIKNSDIDVAIDNCILNYFLYVAENQRTKAALEYLQGIFKAQPCIKNIKLIKTASIPLIKMTMNTKI